MNPGPMVPAWGQQAVRREQLAQDHSYQEELWGPQGALLLAPAPLQLSLLKLAPGLVEEEEGQGNGQSQG